MIDHNGYPVKVAPQPSTGEALLGRLRHIIWTAGKRVAGDKPLREVFDDTLSGENAQRQVFRQVRALGYDRDLVWRIIEEVLTP